jgi:hypothetical protein
VLPCEVNSSLTPRPAFLRNFPACTLSFTSFPAPLLPRRGWGAKLLPVSPFAATLTKTIGGRGWRAALETMVPKWNHKLAAVFTSSLLTSEPWGIPLGQSSIFQSRSAIFSCCLHGSSNSNHSHTYDAAKNNFNPFTNLREQGGYREEATLHYVNLHGLPRIFLHFLYLLPLLYYLNFQACSLPYTKSTTDTFEDELQ